MKIIKYFFLFLLCFLITLFVVLNSKTQASDNLQIDVCEVLSKQKQTSFHGLVKAQFFSDLSFQSEGRVVFMPYSKGDSVKKGQVLARLDGILYKIRKKEESARLKEALIQYNKTKSYYSRMDVLHKAGAISDNDWEEAYYQLKTNKEQIEIQKEKINYLDKEISYNILLAPYDGYISEKYSQIGEIVKIAQPIVQIMGSDVTRVEIMASADEINEVNLNDSVLVKRNDKTYKGKIVHISKTSTNSGGYLIKIDLDMIYKELKDGMDVEVEIALGNSNIFIPFNSVFSDNSSVFVYKILDKNLNNTKIAKQKIVTGRFINEDVEVLSGLKQGEKFVCGNFAEIRKMKRIHK